MLNSQPPGYQLSPLNRQTSTGMGYPGQQSRALTPGSAMQYGSSNFSMPSSAAIPSSSPRASGGTEPFGSNFSMPSNFSIPSSFEGASNPATMTPYLNSPNLSTLLRVLVGKTT